MFRIVTIFVTIDFTKICKLKLSNNKQYNQILTGKCCKQGL